MRKTTIPVAVVLAASAVPMQAQEAANYTKESLSKRVGDLMLVINKYPTEVKNIYIVQLSAIQADINGLDQNPTPEELDEIAKKIQTVADEAAAKEKSYADARAAAKQAKTEAETAKSTAGNDLQELVVPSVKTSYKEKLGELPVPEMPSDDKLYNDINLANSTKSAWDAYKSSIESLVAEAQGADEAEQAAQPGRKTTLEEIVASVNVAAEAALPIIQGYWNYAEGDANATAIQDVIDALPGISDDIEASLTAWELTEGKATTYTNTLNEKSGVVTASVAAAETAAKDAAQAYADSKVSGLTPYEEPIAGDDYIIAAKQAVNTAIANAKAKAEEVAAALDKASHESLAAELDELVDAVAPAQAAVTAAENNYTAYQSLVTKYNELKPQYDASAIDLSTLKAQGNIDEQLYNDANGKLNVVAQNLQNLSKTNDENYAAQKYEGGTSDEDYTKAVALLGDYTTVASIAQIVTDATNLNTTLADIKKYQTRVDTVVVIVKSEKYTEQADTLTSELTKQKTTVTGLITELESDFRANNALNSEKDATVNAAVAALENAATKAAADMQAYEQSKETLAGWTTSVNAILAKIILDEKFNKANSTAYNALATAKTQAESIKSEIEGLESNVEGAFAITEEHTERSSQATLSIINDKDYDFETLESTVDTNMKTYNDWLNEQGDVAAYELGLKYVNDLNDALVAAKKATADDALGYAEDAAAIEALEKAIKDKHNDEEHKFNDCIAELSTWSKTNDSITTSINTHKTAWETNNTAYTTKQGQLNGIKGLELYGKLNDTNKATVDSAIDAALNDLDGKNGEQKAAEYDATTAVSTIENSIAQKVLQQELDEAGITTALETARDSVTTNVGWNPSNYYTGLLDDYETTAGNFTKGVVLKDYATKSAEIATLKNNIEAVPTKAKENYTAYQSQTASQTEAKADWAKIYSSVGATYGNDNDLAGAQKLYQDSLNVCFTVLTGYDTDIETRYNNGTSVEFGTEAYDQAIAENKELMEKIEGDAKANKNAYDLQAETLTALNNSYTTTAKDLEAKLKEIEAAIETAVADENVSDEDKKALQQQKTDLVGYQAELETVKSNIDALAATALEKVNAGESVGYATEFGKSNTTISTEIGTISSKANGTYNENVVAHNKVIRQLFEKAYSDAKAVYHQLVLDLEKYAGYKHALTDGKSAYAEEIAKANQTVFSLNTQLVNEYTAADSVFNADAKKGKYTDKEQAHKANVNNIKTGLENAYSAFLAATQAIATENNYAMPLSDLKTAYENALADVEAYTYSEDALKKFEGIDGTKLNADYETALADNKGPQVLDDLRAQVESLQNSVTNAYNDAAKVEADSTIEAAKPVVATYKAMTYPSSITKLSVAVSAAESAISNAEDSISTHHTAKTLPKNLDTILAGLNGIERSLSDAKDAADEAVRSEKQELQQEGGTWYEYNKTIEGISTAISGYEGGDYAAKLTDLIATAKEKVATATTANNNALDVLYENGTGAVDTAIVAAQDALQDIKDKVADLQANTPAGIVAALLKDAQALVPLYNRAEANAKGNSEAEGKCKAIYTELTSLLATLQPDKNAEGYNETLEGIAAEKDSYDDQISNLKELIIAADLEQVAYNELLASLAEVKDSLDGVKATIAASEEFRSDLEREFNGTITEIENTLSAAEQNINIDHANNLCGKETATVKAAVITAISEKITKLSADVTAKKTALVKAKADADTREANEKAYESAKASIEGVKTALDTAWENAQTSDVYTLFYDEVGEEGGETGLYGQIASLDSSLEEAYTAAQNVGGDPSVLNTDSITSSVAIITSSIEDLTKRISERQAQYVTDVETLKTNIKEMEKSYATVKVKISDIAAADEEVQAKKAEIDKAIADIDKMMEDLGPNDIESVLGQIDDANTLIEALADLAASKTYIPGDIDSDGKVDVLDLALIRDLVSGKTDSSSLDENQQKAADMDGDGEYTVADFVQVNNVYVYGNKLGQNVAVAKAAMKNQQEPGSVAMQMDTANMDVMLNSTVGYAAIQMDVVLPAGVSITEVEFAGESKSVMMTANVLENGACRLMLYTVNSSNMLNGENRLLNLKLAGEGTGVVSIDNIIASTGAGQRHDLDAVSGVYTIVTGIEAVEASEGKSSIFDINGMVRKTMQKGVNIVKDAAGKVKKILVK